MGARNLTESTVMMIRDLIKNNIASALVDIRAERADAKVPTPVPQNFFISDKQWAYRCPAVFIIATNVDLALSRGQNHINSKQDVTISVVIEDKDSDALTIGCYRYQDALFEILDGAQVVSADTKIKIVVKVVSVIFSETFSLQDNNTIFRKEVAVMLEVEHWEQP